jgi:diguanylate cyclase (GGDEF)-like protein
MEGGLDDAGVGYSEAIGDHGAWEWDLETLEIRWTDGLFRIHGVSAGEWDLNTESLKKLIHAGDQPQYAATVQQAIADRSTFLVQHRIVRPDGVERTLLVRGAFIEGDGDIHDRLVGTTQDVTGREGQEEKLWHLANEDGLTGLFNRRRFMDELSHEVAVARRSGDPGVVLMLDLDRFKDINDSLGHMAGDNLLVRVGELLAVRLRDTDRLARLGGDEFALILPSCSATEARAVSERLLGALSAEAVVKIAGRERHVTASIGIAPYGGDAQGGADELLVEADLAMYRGKQKGGDRVEIFDAKMREELAARMQVELELREALDADRLEAHYQPIVSLVDGSPVGAEALCRWPHPTRGMVPPDEFIPIAEEQGFIGKIGETILAQACSQAIRWRHTGAQAYVSVNVSPVELLQDDVVARVEEALRITELPPPLLQLEVTETSLINDTAKISPALQGLRDLGVRIAIDDFGGGTSSLTFLSALPIDVIKIDRLFIAGLVERDHDRAIVAAVISLAEELELSVIAEGVETERQHAELRELGCRYGQGFLYAKPQPASELVLDGYTNAIQPGVGDPSVIREFMRQIGIPARIES